MNSDEWSRRFQRILEFHLHLLPHFGTFYKWFCRFFDLHLRNLHTTQLAAIVLWPSLTNPFNSNIRASNTYMCFFPLFGWSIWQVIRNWFSTCVLCFRIVYLGIRSERFIKCVPLLLLCLPGCREPFSAGKQKNIENQYIPTYMIWIGSKPIYKSIKMKC